MQGVTYCANHERNWSVQIMFHGKPDEAMRRRVAKELGLTWAPSESAWIRRGHWVPTNVTAFLAEIGAVKVDDIEREALSFGERFEEKRDEAEERHERLETAAEKASAEATRRFSTVHQIADMIPFGQPILVGHHSEGRHRAAIKRIETNIDKGCEANKKARELEYRAASAGANLKGYDKPGFLARRIKECEAEIRKMKRDVEKWPHTADHYAPFIAEQQSKLDFCNERLAELGGVSYGPGNIAKGMRLNGEFGLCTVRRVNPTSVTVDYHNPAIAMLNPAKLEYGRIKGIAAEVV